MGNLYPTCEGTADARRYCRDLRASRPHRHPSARARQFAAAHSQPVRFGEDRPRDRPPLDACQQKPAARVACAVRRCRCLYANRASAEGMAVRRAIDPDAFWTAQNTAVAARRAAYLKDGWSDVVIVPATEYFHSWEYEKAGKRKG